MIVLLPQVSIYVHLPILLIIFSLVYSATRHDRWDLILKEAAGWIIRIAMFLGSIGVVLYLLSSHDDNWPYLYGVAGVILIYYIWSMTNRQQPAKPTTTTSRSAADSPANTRNQQ
jgi:drug/metabolite transporter (DMT)-like permease